MIPDNDQIVPPGGSATYGLRPGDTHTIRSADTAVQVTMSFDDETSITVTLSPNQALRFRQGRALAADITLEPPETPIGEPLRLVEADNQTSAASTMPAAREQG